MNVASSEEGVTDTRTTEPAGTGSSSTDGCRNMLALAPSRSIAVMIRPVLEWLHWTTMHSTETGSLPPTSLNPSTCDGARSENTVNRTRAAAAEMTSDRRPIFTIAVKNWHGDVLTYRYRETDVKQHLNTLVPI